MKGNIFAKTLELLEERGWCQKRSVDRDGKLCLGWALVMAADSDRDTYIAADAWLQNEIGNSIVVWNDYGRRTFEEVRDLLQRAVTGFDAIRAGVAGGTDA